MLVGRLQRAGIMGPAAIVSRNAVRRVVAQRALRYLPGRPEPSPERAPARNALSVTSFAASFDGTKPGAVPGFCVSKFLLGVTHRRPAGIGARAMTAQPPAQYVHPASCARFTPQVPDGMMVIPGITLAAHSLAASSALTPALLASRLL